MIVSGAGVEGHAPCSRAVELLDLYPTLSEHCALKERPAYLQGRSFAPLLRNPQARWDHHAITQVRRPHSGRFLKGYSIRNERYRYSVWDDGKEGEEFYDYRTDPREMKNLAKIDGAHTGTQRMLGTRLRSILATRQTPAELA